MTQYRPTLPIKINSKISRLVILPGPPYTASLYKKVAVVNIIGSKIFYEYFSRLIKHMLDYFTSLGREYEVLFYEIDISQIYLSPFI